MSNPWNGLYRILDVLDESELRAIRRRCDWCGAQPPGKAKTSFSMRIRDNAKRSVEKGEYSLDEVIKQIHNVIRVGGYTPETRIKHVLLKTQIYGQKRPSEENISKQMYGALRNEFGNKYDVYREYRLPEHQRYPFDLYIENTKTNKCYLIESKIAENISENKLLGQIHKYHQLINKTSNIDREKTFVFVIAEDDDEWWREIYLDPGKRLEDCFEYPENLESDIESYHRTQVVTRVLGEEVDN